MALPMLKEKQGFTYGDYLTWPDEERWEIIEGVPYDMSPAPAPRHQDIALRLGAQFLHALKGKPCKVYIAPIDVFFPLPGQSDEESENVVQPDLIVVCDRKKITERGCKGAPDFVIEVLSPSTSVKDQIEKVALYEAHGVKEYWVIHPLEKLLTIRLLGRGKRYGAARILKGEGRVSLTALPGVEIDLDMVFAET
ncbi:MAG: Uma2 family endonuclease [Candidatus Sumerlaeota bacterium]|nr:Uma2 family endonuclease [Candidatus Sumerlaeota bacterium]